MHGKCQWHSQWEAKGAFASPFFQDITYNIIYKILRQNIALEVFRAGKYQSKAKRKSLFFCDKPIADFERVLRFSLNLNIC